MIIFAALHFTKLNITLNEFYSIYPPKTPMINEYSSLFFKAVNDGNLDIVTRLYKSNKFFIHEFDHVLF